MSSSNTNKSKDKSLHIAMYPWFAYGHLTSFLNLANKLAQRGHKVSFFLPTKTQTKLASHNHHPNLITFIPISVPSVHGLPAGAETTNDVPASSRACLMDAMDLTRPVIDTHLSHLKPDYIFFDFTEWVPNVARKYSIKSIYYSTSYLVSMTYTIHRARNLPDNHQVKEADLLSPPPGFPCPAIRMRAQEARTYAYICQMIFGGGMTLAERKTICFEDCDIVAIKTCREIEGAYIDFFLNHWDKPTLLVGPVMPEPPASRLDDYFDGWLKGFGHGSVVYCALGSECVLGKDQFQALVSGLELTECDVVASNTSREMEGRYCDFIKKQIDKPVLLTGPMVPKPPSSKLDEYLDCWLKGFGYGEVLYCALGSECVLNKDQFQELVLGLELTRRPFLAALQPPSEYETIEQALPEGYVEKIKGRGIIHSGWVQQPLLLHHPSVGCFVTHCGAGSLSEGMLSECQLVLIPQAVDQFVNARMMSLDLKVGVEIEKGEDDGFFTKQAVFEAIEMVMEPESVIGKEVRENHTKVRNLLSKEGLEDSYIDGFVQSLKEML